MLFTSLFVIVLVVGAAIWLWEKKSSPPLTSAIMSKENLAEGTVPQRSVTPSEPASEPAPPGYKGLSDPRWNERKERLRIDSAYEWKMPLNFYGRVVDENKLPVVGAKVDIEWSDTSESGASSTEVVSDATGRFELTGKQGNGLTVRIAKSGYYTPKNIAAARFENTRFWDINYYEPDPNDPVLFHLRKRGEGELLQNGEITISIPVNGTPVRFDLLNEGRVSPDGGAYRVER